MSKKPIAYHHLRDPCGRTDVQSAAMVRTCQQVFEHMHRMDDMPPAVQIMSSLVLAKVICEVKGLDVREAMTWADNFIRYAESLDSEHLKALRTYTKRYL